jgi:hypothetical protein
MLRARDAGLEWEPATQAAAAGLANHHGTVIATQPVAQPHASTLALVLSGVITYIVLRPPLALGDELAVTARRGSSTWPSELAHESPSSDWSG